MQLYKYLLLFIALLAIIDCKKDHPETPPSSPEGAELECPEDLQTCPDGSTVGRDIDNDCEFFACPEVPDVPEVSEVPEESEEVPEVSEEVPEVSEEVPEVSEEVPEVSEEVPEVSEEVPEVSEEVPEVSEEVPEESEEDKCESGECPTGPSNPEPLEGLCALDAKVCPDGSYVGRNPDNECEFYACLNNTDCLHGTKRFGGYCACWSGAFGKTCTMGSAKVGTAVGSIINNAFSANVRSIADMYYKIDFDLMLGKSFLRNFTGHPSCPTGSWEKVTALETNGVPRLDSAAFSSGALVLQVSQNLVDGRADGAVFLNNDNVDGLHVDCYYPRSNYVEKLVQGCRDTWRFSVPWNTAKTCGWRISSEETHVVYRGQVVIHNMEWVHIQQWRIIRSVLRVKIRFQRYIRVECDTKIFNEKIKQAAITRQIVAIQLGQPALVELTTIINWPYKLYNGRLTLYPTNNISSFEFTSIDCTSSEGEECVQNWRTNLHMEEYACQLDGNYAMNFTLGCGEDVSESDCPVDAHLEDCRIEYSLRSEDFCAEIQIDVGIYGYIMCYLDSNYSQHKEIFIIGQRAYFLIKINSDLNPRNGSGSLDADFYDEATAVIKFSKVTLVCITVRFESTGEVIRLLENGKPCPDVFGVGLSIESSYGDGSAFSSNTVAFSFTMTRSLLQLKQHARTSITVGAELEAHYSDSTSKRMYLETNTDKSTFSTNPEIQDDGNGEKEEEKDPVYSSSIELLVSFFLMVLAFLF